MRPRAILTALAITTAAALTLTSSAHAAPLLPTALFDPAQTGWKSYRDLTSAGYAAKFAALKSDWMLADLDVDVIDGKYRVGAVFRANTDGRGWASLRNLTAAQFHAKWLHYRGRGYRLHDQEVYRTAGGALRYAGIWIENREKLPWASYRDATAAQHAARFQQYRGAGYVPVDIDVYQTASGLRYGAAWVHNSEQLTWKLRRGLTSAQYAAAFKTYKAQGLRSLVTDSYPTAAGQRYAGIWVENRSKRGWAAYRDMSATGFRNRWNQLSDVGYRLDSYEKYATAAGARYAGIWRQNSDRPDWPLRSKVDGIVQKELDDHEVPGFSVAVSHKGKIVYQRGFGHQDKAAGVWMHGGSVNRIASVSKAVAGVLALRLAAKHAGLGLTDKVRTHLPWLPSKHDYTVAQTVTNRSCVKRYPAPMKIRNQTQYETAKKAVEAFMDDDLGCTPGEYLYSTHAYTVLGAVLEKFEGKPVDRIVRDELTTPFGLMTLRPETLAGSLPDRVQLYKTNNDEYDGDDTSNKTLGGGLVSTAPDLVRFGDAILDGTLLTSAQRTTLWSAIDGYAYGWNVGSTYVGKSGGQPGANSYLRIEPNEGIVIAVLSNRWRGGHDASSVSKKIGDAMLADLP